MKNPFKFLRRKKHPKEFEVVAAILESRPGFSNLQKTTEVGAEKLKLPNKKGEEIYSGVVPHVVEVTADILPLPTIFRWIWLRRKFRVRLHHRLFDEPFTRDLYTGEILNQEKKKAVLVERGFQDKDGFLLDKSGNRVNLSDVPENKTFVKVDVSDVDFIKAEYKALLDSKLVEKAAEGMAKTGASLERNFWIVLTISLITNVILVFLMNGGVESLGL